MPIRIVNDNEEFDNENYPEKHDITVSFLKVGNKEYNLLDAYIIGLFVENEQDQISWTIEVQLDADDEIFETFSNILVDDGVTIDELSSTTLENEESLNFVSYEGELSCNISKIIEINFDEYEFETNQIPCTVEAQLNDGSEYFLQSPLEFRGYYYFSKNKNSVKTFVEEYLGYEMDEVEIECEKQEDGSWLCFIF